MNEEIKQQLSDLMDGELDSQRRRFLLRRLSDDTQLSAVWSRWHLTRDCLRGESSAPLRPDFLLGISQAISSESTPGRSSSSQILRFAGGLAVAASVAVAALLAIPGGLPSNDALQGAAVAEIAPAPAARVAASSLTERDLRPELSSVAQTVARSMDARSLDPVVRVDPRLESYLLRHNAALRQQGEASMLPYISLVAPVRPWSMVMSDQPQVSAHSSNIQQPGPADPAQSEASSDQR